VAISAVRELTDRVRRLCLRSPSLYDIERDRKGSAHATNLYSPKLRFASPCTGEVPSRAVPAGKNMNPCGAERDPTPRTCAVLASHWWPDKLRG